MNRELPEAFVNRMREQLGEELSAFLRALDEAPTRGIRINPLKRTDAAETYRTDPIPWVRDAYYLPADSAAGTTAVHEAGAFYLQDPGAMLPAAVLAARPGERILDLCAAPGGKSTQIGCDMQGEGLLVCNEIIPKRAQILSRNIERIGLAHTVVTCAAPEQLAEQWGASFDAVLADAPCSGEGMFRKEPDTRAEWNAEKAAGCAERQRQILTAAARLVRPGGRLVYSTCTYNPAENEENAAWFLRTFPAFRPEGFSLPGIDAPEGMFTCYPHRLRCEGQFAALFRKSGEEYPAMPPDRSLPRPARDAIRIFNDSFPVLPEPTHLFGHTLVRLPACPDLQGIRVFRIGLHLGEVKGKIAVPDHAAALCFRPPEIRTLALDEQQILQYLAGETIPGEAEGWVMMAYRDLVFGWGKGSGGTIRNHYPKGLRNARLIS